MTARIEAMSAAYVEEVAAIDRACFPASLGPPRNSADQVKEELTRPWSHTWVALDEGRVVAFVLYWHVADELHILNVATDPARRRRGHARALMEHVLGVAAKGAIRHVLLEVRRSNAVAIGLYRRLGFAAVGLRRQYYPNDEDALEMALSFDPSTGAIVPRKDEVPEDPPAT